MTMNIKTRSGLTVDVELVPSGEAFGIYVHGGVDGAGAAGDAGAGGDAAGDAGADRELAGQAFFYDRAANGDSDGALNERVFYHTEVDDAFGGKGLGRVVVENALEKTIEDGLTVVPICPLFKKILDEDGDDWKVKRLEFRAVRPADLQELRSRLK